MRVVSGFLKGRSFEAPAGHRTHPMSEKARGALFSALGDIRGLSVLDAFAGSGALAIEAVSQGAAGAVAVEIDKNAAQTIEANLKALDLEKAVQVIRANAFSWSDNNAKQQFDLLFADPPYDKLSLQLLQKLMRHVQVGGLYVLSWPGNLTVPELVSGNLVKTKSYGDNQLAFYRRIP